MLLILAYMHSHPRSVLLIDEPDAHLEILRQRQAYALLRDVAARNESQVVLVTHGAGEDREAVAARGRAFAFPHPTGRSCEHA